MADEAERAYQLAKTIWNPAQVFDGHSFTFVEPLSASMLQVGMALGHADTDSSVLLRAVNQGFEDAAHEYQAVIKTHEARPLCDPNDPYPMCDYCTSYISAVEASRQDRSRWARETENPDLQYAVTGSTAQSSSGEGRIHWRDCSAITRVIAYADERLKTLTPGDVVHSGEVVSWPHLLNLDAAIAANRHRCQICVPDLPDRLLMSNARATDGRYM